MQKEEDSDIKTEDCGYMLPRRSCFHRELPESFDLKASMTKRKQADFKEIPHIAVSVCLHCLSPSLFNFHMNIKSH